MHKSTLKLLYCELNNIDELSALFCILHINLENLEILKCAMRNGVYIAGFKDEFLYNFIQIRHAELKYSTGIQRIEKC